ncbi:hypothetical protein H0N96_01535 [Candidatus Micrarchaeota archaeon]|nr:hypothetical protein [Candidatus Micrarchaeota archaeon]
MKTPLCNACCATATLCAGCAEKLAAKELSDADVTLSRALHARTLAGEFPANSGFEKTITVDSGNLVIVFTDSPAALIGKSGRTVAALSKELGKRMKIIDSNADEAEKIRELLLPAQLKGVNTLYKREGKEFKVRVARADAQRLPLEAQTLAGVLKQVLGANASISLE